jgi:hypothetical protein
VEEVINNLVQPCCYIFKCQFSKVRQIMFSVGELIKALPQTNLSSNKVQKQSSG